MQRSDDAFQFAIFKEAILQKSGAGGNQVIWWFVTCNFAHLQRSDNALQFAIFKEAILQRSDDAFQFAIF